jgi:hypothetical protein
MLAAEVKTTFQRNYRAVKMRFAGLEAFVFRLAEG